MELSLAALIGNLVTGLAATALLAATLRLSRGAKRG